ncbi:MAG: cob(I)yrinic acid a,c-diamide adenosyltransferase [Acidimicrobiia bacterium]|nr:cob(I)yrinic acid a,c-diamide adenosyltransferase [Acidimicrobiia bacterium]
MKIYTKKGDDGTTGLFYGGRVRKDDTGPEAYGAVDEAVAALGVARTEAGDELADRLLSVQRQLFVVAAELATDPGNRRKLEPGVSLVTDDMVEQLERWIDEIVDDVGMPDQFVVPGRLRLPALLDVARSVVRRAERRAVTHAAVAGMGDGAVVRYLNRLADYIYMLVRAAETEWEPSRVNGDA